MSDNPAKSVPGWVKQALDLGPPLLFFLAFIRFRDEVFVIGDVEYTGFVMVTAGFVPLLAASIGLLWWLTGEISRMQILTLVLVIFFGGLTVWLNDERFIKMKPTFVFLFFSGVLGFGLWRGRSYLHFVMKDVLPMQPEGWMILTRRVTVFFFALAVANELVWRLLSTDLWVTIDTFGLPAAIFIFFMAQAPLMMRYEIKDAPEDAGQ